MSLLSCAPWAASPGLNAAADWAWASGIQERPGRSRLQYLWLVYGLSFLLSLSALGALERALFRNPKNFMIYYAAAFGLAVGLDIYQRLFVYEKLRLLYEDKPDPVMVTLVEA